jgi:hypothetical protein
MHASGLSPTAASGALLESGRSVVGALPGPGMPVRMGIMVATGTNRIGFCSQDPGTWRMKLAEEEFQHRAGSRTRLYAS